MFGRLRRAFDGIKNQPAEFETGDMVRLKVNPEIRGQVLVKGVPMGFGSVSWDYDVRRTDGVLMTGFRAHELVLDR